MNSDIRIVVSFKGHRKRKKLVRLIGHEAVGCLLDLWIGAAMSNPNGNLVGWDHHDIASEAGWSGDPDEFVSALVECRFLDVDDENGAYTLHDWATHNPWAAGSEERSNESRLKRMAHTHKDLYERLKKEGVKGITAEEYRELTRGGGTLEETVNMQLTAS